MSYHIMQFSSILKKILKLYIIQNVKSGCLQKRVLYEIILFFVFLYLIHAGIISVWIPLMTRKNRIKLFLF